MQAIDGTETAIAREEVLWGLISMKSEMGYLCIKTLFNGIQISSGPNVEHTSVFTAPARIVLDLKFEVDNLRTNHLKLLQVNNHFMSLPF